MNVVGKWTRTRVSLSGALVGAVTLLSFSRGCTVGGMAVGSAIDRTGWERTHVTELARLAEAGAVVRGETADGNRFEGRCESLLEDTLLLHPVPEDSPVFQASARVDTLQVLDIVLLEARRNPGRYRDMFAFSGLVLDTVVVSYLVGGLSRGFE